MKNKQVETASGLIAYVPIFSHSINGKRIEVGIADLKSTLQANGVCCMTKERHPKPAKILIGSHIRSDRFFLEVAIHEHLHASFPEISEKRIMRAGKDLARFIRRFK